MTPRDREETKRKALEAASHIPPPLLLFGFFGVVVGLLLKRQDLPVLTRALEQLQPPEAPKTIDRRGLHLVEPPVDEETPATEPTSED